MTRVKPVLAPRVVLMLAAGLTEALLFSTTSVAQTSRNIDLPRFEPSPAGDRFFGVPSPSGPGNGILRAEALLD